MKVRSVVNAKVIGSLVALALLAAVVLATVRYSQQAPPRVSAATHPAVTSQRLCTSCKEPKHRFVHTDPYQGDCRLCHNTSSWRRTTYVHATLEMDRGMHSVIGCGFCHTATRPRPNAGCGTCHTPQHSPLPSCSKCHEALSWRLIRPVPSGHVSLAYGHVSLNCFDCHKGPAAFSKPKACVTCHGVKHGGLTNCAQCHDPSLKWKPKGGFNHSDYYVLKGLHRLVPCAKCHPGGRFAAANPKCGSCHRARHGGLTNCARCHTTSGFKPSTFRHASVFRLVGQHARLRCSRCHPGLRYAANIRRGSGCSGCHGARHGGLTNCSRCHNQNAFSPSTFRHSSVFVLSGAHSRLACTRCHPRSRYAANIRHGSGCSGCHGAKHGGLTNCASCHNQNAFMPPTFRHSSKYPLTGAHATLPCTKCHPGGAFAKVIGSPSACVNCHDAYHGNQTACAKCHTTTAFAPAKVISHPVFPALGGEHAARSCRLCHPTLVFSSPARACRACHDAPHVAPTDCLRCHRPTVWSDLHFTHSEIGNHTQLPIEQACARCHTTGNYTVYRCDGCHQPY